MAKAPDKAKPLDITDRLNDPEFRARIEEGIKNMPPEKAAELLAMLESSLRRRKIELIGYLSAAAVLLIGMVIALYIYGASDHSNFMSWVFLIPMGLAGLVMWAIGRWSNAERKKAKAAKPGV